MSIPLTDSFVQLDHSSLDFIVSGNLDLRCLTWRQIAGVVRSFQFFGLFESEWDFIEREKLRARTSVVNGPLVLRPMRALGWLQRTRVPEIVVARACVYCM